FAVLVEAFDIPEQSSHFPQAQIYYASKQYEKAIEAFQAFLKEGSDQEELWFSRYQIGQCYEALQQWTPALSWYLEAYQYFPERAELLKKIACHYRQVGHNNLTCLFALEGKEIPRPRPEASYVNPFVYDFQLDEELSIAAFYTPYKEKGFEAA